MKGVAVGGAVVAACLGIGIQIAGGQQKPQTVTVYKHLRLLHGQVEICAPAASCDGPKRGRHRLDHRPTVPSRLESCHTILAGAMSSKATCPLTSFSALKERQRSPGLRCQVRQLVSGMEVPGAPRGHNVVSFDKQGTLALTSPAAER